MFAYRSDGLVAFRPTTMPRCPLGDWCNGNTAVSKTASSRFDSSVPRSFGAPAPPLPARSVTTGWMLLQDQRSIYLTPMGELQPGTVFAGHRIETVAGRGGMGVVYRATQLALDRTVALKVIAAGLLEDQTVRARFVRESKIAASIDHPNVIPIYYAGEEDGIAYIAMRYVAGDDIRSLVRREGPLDPERAARIVAQIGRRPRRRARRRPRAPRHQARQRPARPGGSRLPHGLRAHQARALDGGHDEARPLGRNARLRRARADPRRAGGRARRRLRARLPPVLHADRRGPVQARGRRGAAVGAPARPAAQAVRARRPGGRSTTSSPARSRRTPRSATRRPGTSVAPPGPPPPTSARRNASGSWPRAPPRRSNRPR